MTVPELNLDVYTHIITFVRDGKDLCRVGRVRRSFYDISAVALLRNGVELRAQRHLSSFLTFISRDPQHLAPFFTDLLVVFEPDDIPQFGESSAYIARILRQGEFLKKLTLDGYLFDTDARIGAAFVTLQHIANLTLCTAGGVRSLVPFLAVMRSKCVRVHIDYDSRFMEGDLHVRNDPNLALMSCTDSLEHLELVSPEFELDAVVYPLLTTLEISNCDFRLKPLMWSFPNLRYLHVDDTLIDGLQHMREENRVACSQPGAWTELARFEGPFDHLYILGLTCPVRHWKTSYPNPPTVHRAAQFEACLRDIRPLILQLSLRLNSGESIEHVLAPLLGSRMSQLSLNVTLKDSVPADVTRLADDLADFIEQQKLVYLELGIYPASMLLLRSVYLPNEVSRTAPEVVAADAMYDRCSEVGQSTTANRFFAVDVALEHYFFRLAVKPGESRSNGDRYWTVDRQAGGTLIEISEKEGQAKIISKGLEPIEYKPIF